jgi:hypothetical protein
MTPIRKREDDKREAVGEGKAVEEETAVVALSSPFSPPSNNAAAPIEQRRLEAQRHRHGEVWTKDPHGGRHRPVSRLGRRRGVEKAFFSFFFSSSFSLTKK